MFPLKKFYRLEDIPKQNRFGAKRRWDFHTGVDLFCDPGTPVFAFESGKVVDVSIFTGPAIGMDWWAETWYVAVEGVSGIILYGELYQPIYQVGDMLEEGEFIGKVKTVLLKDKGNPMSMLHIELYEKEYTGWVEWKLETEKPKNLRNIEELIFKDHKFSDFYDIHEEFVPFEISKILKRTNFNLPCLAWYNNESGNFNILGQEDTGDPSHIHTTFFTPEITQAPLWSQVIRWLMIEHHIFLSTRKNDVTLNSKWIFVLETGGSVKYGEPYKTEYAALIAGLLTALSKISNE